MKASRILRFLLNIAGGLMLLAAAGGSAQAMAPAKSLPVVSVQNTSDAVYDHHANTATYQKVYYGYYGYRRFYRPRFFYRPYRFYYRPRFFYRPYYYRRRFFF